MPKGGGKWRFFPEEFESFLWKKADCATEGGLDFYGRLSQKRVRKSCYQVPVLQEKKKVLRGREFIKKKNPTGVKYRKKGPQWETKAARPLLGSRKGDRPVKQKRGKIGNGTKRF